MYNIKEDKEYIERIYDSYYNELSESDNISETKTKLTQFYKNLIDTIITAVENSTTTRAQLLNESLKEQHPEEWDYLKKFNILHEAIPFFAPGLPANIESLLNLDKNESVDQNDMIYAIDIYLSFYNDVINNIITTDSTGKIILNDKDIDTDNIIEDYMMSIIEEIGEEVQLPNDGIKRYIDVPDALEVLADCLSVQPGPDTYIYDDIIEKITGVPKKATQPDKTSNPSSPSSPSSSEGFDTFKFGG